MAQSRSVKHFPSPKVQTIWQNGIVCQLRTTMHSSEYKARAGAGSTIQQSRPTDDSTSGEAQKLSIRCLSLRTWTPRFSNTAAGRLDEHSSAYRYRLSLLWHICRIRLRCGRKETHVRTPASTVSRLKGTRDETVLFVPACVLGQERKV